MSEGIDFCAKCGGFVLESGCLCRPAKLGCAVCQNELNQEGLNYRRYANTVNFYEPAGSHELIYCLACGAAYRPDELEG